MSEKKIKAKAGYVQVEAFADAGEGYFCGTCRAFRPVSMQKGRCSLLDVSIVTYGCCNHWKLGQRDSLIGADGCWLYLEKL